jgi:hypothetical protein
MKSNDSVNFVLGKSGDVATPEGDSDSIRKVPVTQIEGDKHKAPEGGFRATIEEVYA